jgi:hypothetical protein
MYTDKQLRQFGLHFFLIQAAFDTPAERIPLFELLDKFLSDSYAQFEKSTASKIIITDGIVDKNRPCGVHILWID